MKKFMDCCGAALLEVMISIAMLGLLLMPICSGIVMSQRINVRSDQILKARLAVSSAVETIMAVGVKDYIATDELDVQFVDEGAYLEITVTHKKYTDIFVKTYVRDDIVRGDLPQTASLPGGGA